MSFISFSPGHCSENIWWLLIWPVSSTSLFLFLYVLAMTESTHPSEQSHLYLTLSFGSQTHKVCNAVIPGTHPSPLCPAMNMIWLCITSVLSVTRVICDQSIDMSRIGGRSIQLFWSLSYIKMYFVSVDNEGKSSLNVEFLVKFESAYC